MKTKLILIVGLAIAACTLLGAGAPNGTRWWSYIEFLASDKLEGRNTGSEGHLKAAEFVAAQFQRDGLKPAGTHGYVQPVAFNTRELDESDSSLTLETNGKEHLLTLGEEARSSARVLILHRPLKPHCFSSATDCAPRTTITTILPGWIRRGKSPSTLAAHPRQCPARSRRTTSLPASAGRRLRARE